MTDYRSKIDKTPEIVDAYSELSKVQVRQLYRHLKSGQEYAFEGLRTVKFKGEWFDMVDYYAESDSIPRHKFSRPILDFLESFKIIVGQFAYN